MPSIVNDDLTYYLWSQAQKRGEWATTKFWDHIFRREISGDEYVHGAEQPSTDDGENRSRVDRLIDKWKGKKKGMHRLLHREDKASNVTQTSIDEVETQIFRASVSHLNYVSRDHMYAVTTVGTKIRFWVVHINDDYPTAWIPEGAGLADKSEYIEANSTEGHRILEAINYMKKYEDMPENKLRALRQNTYSTASIQRPSPDNTVREGEHSSPASRATQVSGPSVGSSSTRLPIQSISLTSSRQPSSGSGAYNVTYAPSTDIVTYSPHAGVHPLYASASSVAAGQSSYTAVESNPDTWIRIHPTVEERKGKEDKIHWRYKGQDYVKHYGDFYEDIVTIDGDKHECFVYHGKTTQIHFWTDQLRDLHRWKGKSKS